MTKKVIGIVLSMLLLATVLSVAETTNTQEKNAGKANLNPSDDDWPMFHHDLANTGYSTSNTPETTNVLWSYQTGYAVHSSPSVVDGMVYIGSNDRKIYCLDAENGLKIWESPISGDIRTGPAVIEEKVYVTVNGIAYCFNAINGTEIWMSSIGGAIFSSPAVANGKVYFGSQNKKVYCLDADNGSCLWTYTTGGMVYSSPAVVNGRVYIGSDDKKVYCLDADPLDDGVDEGFDDPDGAEYDFIWSFLTSGSMWDSSPAVIDDKIYIGTLDKKVYCLNANNGTKLWAFTTGSSIRSCPVLAYDKVYVAGSTDKKIYCLYANNGTLKWEYTTGGSIYSSPAVADGKVYVGSNKLYCLNASTGLEILTYQISVDVSSPTIVDGKIYIGSGYKVYCFGDNLPPEIPDAPLGLTQGLVGEQYTYITNEVTDPDGDAVKYKFVWDDGTDSGWLEEPSASKIWESDGVFNVTVIVTDQFVEVESESLEVTIADLSVSEIKGGLGVSSLIENVGETSIEADLTLKVIGGIFGFIKVTHSVTVEISAGEEYKLSTKKVFGLGKVTIIVSIFELEETREGIAIGPFVHILPNATDDVLDQKQTEDSGAGFGFYGTNIWYAQGFVPSLETLTKVQLYIFKVGTPPDDVEITLSIRDSKNGQDLTSITKDISHVSTAEWIELDFDDIEVTPGEMYYLVGRLSAGAPLNQYCWVFGINDSYKAGDAFRSTDAGLTWEYPEFSEFPNPDMCFKTYGL